MENYWTFNSMIIVVAFCLFVTALGSETGDRGNEDPLSIPLINDKGAPLVAMLDTNTINRKLKVYIRTLMRNMIQSSIQEQMHGIFKTSLEGNSTIDFVRNITQQEINDVLKEQLQEGTSTIMRDTIKSSIQEQIQGIFKTSLEENPSIDLIRNITLQEITDVLKKQGKEGIFVPSVVQYKDCTDLQRQTKQKLNDGVYTIYPGVAKPIHAYCDMTTDGGGWTVMLKRFGGSVNFERTWVECENGFGDIHGEFWLGNKYTHMLTSSGKYELRVDMVDRRNNTKYAVYKTFVIGNAASKYKLTVGDYSGTAGDQFKHHNGMKFTTVDQDNDIYHINCADTHAGSWWYYNCLASDLTRTNLKPYWGNYRFIAKKHDISLINYLDDFAGAEISEKADISYTKLKWVLDSCGLEESVEKASSPSYRMSFLGVWFDTEKMTMEVTPDRLLEIFDLVSFWLNKDTASLSTSFNVDLHE